MKERLNEIIELFEQENALDEEDLKDAEAVQQELEDLAGLDDEFRDLLDGIDSADAARWIVESNTNPYSGVDALVGLLIDVMERQGSTREDIAGCANGIYRQYQVPVTQRKWNL